MPRSSTRKVVVTGLGIVSPVGVGVAQAWANITAGKSGIAPITHFDASVLTSRVAGEVKNFDVAQWLNAKEARRFDTFIHYGLVAGIEALKPLHPLTTPSVSAICRALTVST